MTRRPEDLRPCSAGFRLSSWRLELTIVGEHVVDAEVAGAVRYSANEGMLA